MYFSKLKISLFIFFFIGFFIGFFYQNCSSVDFEEDIGDSSSSNEQDSGDYLSSRILNFYCKREEQGDDSFFTSQPLYFVQGETAHCRVEVDLSGSYNQLSNLAKNPEIIAEGFVGFEGELTSACSIENIESAINSGSAELSLTRKTDGLETLGTEAVFFFSEDKAALEYSVTAMSDELAVLTLAHSLRIKSDNFDCITNASVTNQILITTLNEGSDGEVLTYEDQCDEADESAEVFASVRVVYQSRSEEQSRFIHCAARKGDGVLIIRNVDKGSLVTLNLRVFNQEAIRDESRGCRVLGPFRDEFPDGCWPYMNGEDIQFAVDHTSVFFPFIDSRIVRIIILIPKI